MEHHGETEQRLIAAGLTLFREAGLGAVTTRAVAARAGVNEVTLFRHFGSKDGLIQAMVDHVLQRFDLSRLAAVEDTVSLADDLARWGLAYLTEVLPIAQVLLLGLLEAVSQPTVASWYLQFPERVPQALAAHLRRLQEVGRVRGGPVDTVAAAFYSTLFAQALTAHLRPESTALDLAKRTASVFASALTPLVPERGGDDHHRHDDH
jgi:AcrR family transcriptional regulator